MKHRSVGIFIILVASLAAVPQASHEFGAFKDAVGERVRVEIWNAFLSLHARGRGSVQVSAAPLPAVASCDSVEKKSAEAALKTAAARSDAAQPWRKEPATRKADVEAARIIVDPSFDPHTLNAAWAFTESPAVLNKILRNVPKVDLARASELAMLVPPGADLDADYLSTSAPVLRRMERVERVRRVETAEVEKHAASDAELAGRERREAQREAKRSRDEIRRLINEGVNSKNLNEVKTAEGFFKVLKVKASGKPDAPAPAAWTWQPGKQISCSGVDSAEEPAPAAPAGE